MTIQGNEYAILMNEEKEIVNGYIDQYFKDNDNEFESLLSESMRYSYLIGGKRIRPIIMRQVCKSLGVDPSHVMVHGAAIEMIHTYSLIHDDLPAMDDDDLRRGHPTNHKKYDEAIAILAGDGLLNYAFELMLDKAVVEDHTKYLKATKIVADAAGRKGMIGGQVADIRSEGKVITAETLTYIHAKKTGALLKAAVLVGAIIGEANEKELDIFRAFGENTGLAFQIRDDMLDILGDESTLGKPIGSDEKNHKSTYVSLYGIEKSKEKLQALTNENIELLKKIEGDTEFLYGLTLFLNNREL